MISPISLGFAAEETNIDTFDVHPTNRWTITDTGMTDVVVDGFLNVSDVGDGSQDVYTLDRDLRDLEGEIETRFYLQGEAGASDYRNAFFLYLYDSSKTEYVRLYINYIDDDECTTEIAYSYDGGTATKSLAGDDRVVAGYWYIFRLVYDISKSDLRLRLYFDNGTKVWDHDWQDISASYNPELFEHDALLFRIYCRSFTNGYNFNYYIDYVEAPFKEREWTQVDEESSAQWKFDSWNLQHIEDNVDDTSEWRLTVPYLDAVSGVITDYVDDYTKMSSGSSDSVYSEFSIYAVDADDGDRHEAFAIKMLRDKAISYSATLQVRLDGNSIGTIDYTQNFEGTKTGPDAAVQFAVALEDDRTRLTCRVRFFADRENRTAYEDIVGDVAISSVAAVPSNEFVLRSYHIADFDGDIVYQWMLEDFSLVERDIFADIGGFIDGIIGFGQDILGGLLDIFFIGFRFLAQIFTVALDGLGELLAVAIEALEPLLTAVENAINDMVNLLVTGAQDLLDAFLTAAEALLSGIEDFFFAVWDWIGFPDFLMILDLIWSVQLDIIAKIPAGFNDVLAYVDHYRNWIIIFLTMVALGYPLFTYMETKNPATYVKSFLDLQVKNVNPLPNISLLGFSIPLGVYVPFALIWFPLLLFELGWSA